MDSINRLASPIDINRELRSPALADENRRFDEKFALRLPEGMREKIGAAARAANRSMNAEIIDRLERSFQFAEVSDLERLFGSQKWVELETRVEHLEAQMRVKGGANE